jgi:hypothetical protein
VDEGGEFAAYAVARWPAFVRALVLLGRTLAEADATARAALVRCVPGWERVQREGDVDAWVWRELLAPGPQVEGTPEVHALVDPAIPDPERRELLLAQLVAWLETVPDEQRTATVLHRVLGLDEGQVADVTGSWVTTPVPPLGEGDLRDALDALPVPSAPVDDVLARAAARRRRRRRVVIGAAVAVLVLAGVATWAGTRPPPAEPPAPEVHREPNLAEVAWYADQDLHLDRVRVELPDVVDLVAVPDGAVVADEDDEIALVDADGVVVALGRRSEDSGLVGSVERGWVAWLEEDGDGTRLVVYDTAGRRVLGETDVMDDARLVAVDAEFVFWTQGSRDWSWAPPGGDPVAAGTGDLLDVSSRVLAEQWTDATIRVTQPLFDLRHDLRGVGAMISPDGDHVLTRVDEPDAGTVRLYDTRSGERVPTGLTRDDLVLAASFGPDGTAVYVVEHRPNAEDDDPDRRLSTSGPQLLKTCFLGAPPPGAFRPTICEVVTQFSRNGGKPLLPG